jgi:hypothetical protein
MRRTRRPMIQLLFVALLVISACEVIDDATYKPKVGPMAADAMQPDATDAIDAPALASGGPCGDSDPRVSVSFARDIQPWMTGRMLGGCMSHMMMRMMGFDLSTYEGLRRGGVRSGTNIIVDGKPCESILVQKLGPAPPFAARMPNDGTILPEEDLTLLKDWIAEGALNN